MCFETTKLMFEANSVYVIYTISEMTLITQIDINQSACFLEVKASKGYTAWFLLKNHLTATYLYIRAENSFTGFTNIHALRGFCKML